MKKWLDSRVKDNLGLTCSASPLNGPSDSEKLESRPLSTEDRLVPTTILRIEGAFCTFELIAWGMGTFRDTPEALEARPSDETTRLTTRPFPVDGATGGLGACLLDEDGLKAEVETGLLKLKLKVKYLCIIVSRWPIILMCYV